MVGLLRLHAEGTAKAACAGRGGGLRLRLDKERCSIIGPSHLDDHELDVQLRVEIVGHAPALACPPTALCQICGLQGCVRIELERKGRWPARQKREQSNRLTRVKRSGGLSLQNVMLEQKS
jgi:hypothetical protein